MAEIDLDQKSNTLKRVSFTQDLYSVHSSLWLVFTSEKKLNLKEDSVRYQGTLWKASSFKEFRDAGSWNYNALFFPAGTMLFIDRKAENTERLASLVNTQLSPGSFSLDLLPPVINQYFAPALYKYRLNSLESMERPDDSFVLFFSGAFLLSTTWKKLMSSPALDMDSAQSPVGSSSFEVIYTNQYQYNLYARAHPPFSTSYKSYYATLFDEMVTMKTRLNYEPGRPYKLTTGHPSIDVNSKYILIKAEYDSEKQPLPFTYLFGRPRNA